MLASGGEIPLCLEDTQAVPDPGTWHILPAPCLEHPLSLLTHFTEKTRLTLICIRGVCLTSILTAGRLFSWPHCQKPWEGSHLLPLRNYRSTQESTQHRSTPDSESL